MNKPDNFNDAKTKLVEVMRVALVTPSSESFKQLQIQLNAIARDFPNEKVKPLLQEFAKDLEHTIQTVQQKKAVTNQIKQEGPSDGTIRPSMRKGK